MTEITTREFTKQAIICTLFGVMVGIGFYVTFQPYNLRLDQAVAVMFVLFLTGGVFALSIKTINLWRASGKSIHDFLTEDLNSFLEDIFHVQEDDR